MNHPSDQRPHQLNPFVLSSETNMRFIVLSLSAAFLATNIMVRLIYAPFWDSYRTIDAVEDRLLDLDQDALSVREREALYNELQPQVSGAIGTSVVTCIAPFAMLGAMLAVTYIIYRRHPSRIRRQKALQPIPEGKDGAFQTAVRDLADQVDVQAPVLEMPSKSTASDGQVFGFGHPYRMRVGGGLRLLMRRARDRFTAVILHELAHIANDDVKRTYFSQAIWTTVFWFVIVPVSVLSAIALFLRLVEFVIPALNIRMLDQVPPTFLCGSLAQYAVTLAVIASMRSSLLRSREIYADWRASMWGARKGLIDILSKLEDKGRSLFKWWRLHPPAQDRVKALRDSSQLFRVQPDVSFFVGFVQSQVVLGAATFGAMLSVAALGLSNYVNSNAMLAGLLNEDQSYLKSLYSLFVGVPVALGTVVFLSAMVITPIVLLTAVVGGQVQRQALRDMAQNRSMFGSLIKLAVPAMIVALGLISGIVFLPQAVSVALTEDEFASASLPTFAETATQIATMFGTTVQYCVFSWLILGFIYFMARRFLGGYAGKTEPRRRSRLITTGSTLLLLLLFACSAVPGYFMVTAANEQTGMAQLANLLVAVMVVYGIMVVVYGGVVVISLIVTGMIRSKCPECQTPVPDKIVIGKVCQNCGQPLDAWLSLPDEPQGMDSDAGGSSA